jgi:hypothetical protein
VRILAHRAVEKLDLAATLLEFLHEEHLVAVVARQAIRRGDEQTLALADRIP